MKIFYFYYTLNICQASIISLLTKLAWTIFWSFVFPVKLFVFVRLIWWPAAISRHGELIFLSSQLFVWILYFADKLFIYTLHFFECRLFKGFCWVFVDAISSLSVTIVRKFGLKISSFLLSNNSLCARTHIQSVQDNVALHGDLQNHKRYS